MSVQQFWAGRNPREQRLLIITGVVTGVAVLVLTVFGPLLDRWTEVRTRYTDVAEKYAGLQGVAERRRALARECLALRQELQTKGIPTQTNEPELIPVLEQLAQSAGLGFTVFNPRAGKPTREAQITTLEFTTEATFDQMLTLLAKVESHDRLFGIESLDAKPKEAGQDKLNLHFRLLAYGLAPKTAKKPPGSRAVSETELE